MTLRSRFFALTYDRSDGQGREGRAARPPRGTARRGERPGPRDRCRDRGNLAFYGPSVESLTLTEPEVPMLRRLERKVREQAPGRPSFVPRPRTFHSRTTPSTPPSRPWCSAGSTTSHARFGSCAGCCARGPPPLHRARPLRRRQARPQAGADERASTGSWSDASAIAQRLTSIVAGGFEVERIEHTTAKKIPIVGEPLIVGSATVSGIVPSQEPRLAE